MRTGPETFSLSLTETPFFFGSLDLCIVTIKQRFCASLVAQTKHCNP
jgi:hypothetical protein